MNLRFILVAVSIISINTASRADFRKVSVNRMPLLRLVMNQQKAIEEDPNNSHSYYALGRLYAMAFAEHSDTVNSLKRIGEDEYIPYYGFDKKLPHYFIPKPMPKDSDRINFGKECLVRAIQAFRTAIDIDTNDVPSMLGLAWSTQYLDNKEEAIKLYREALKKSNKLLDKNEVISIETAEISSYLTSLLDKDSNAVEIEQLSHNIKNFEPNYLISPILIPLENNIPFETLIDTNNYVPFNLDPRENKVQWQWITPKAGWLVYLGDKNEPVSSGLQLFGNMSFNIFWDNGYQALSLLDDDRDGLVNGVELKNLALWNDKNSDGLSTPDEIEFLEEMGVESLNYKAEKINDKLLKSPAGVKFKNGTTRPSYDWFPSGQGLRS